MTLQLSPVHEGLRKLHVLIELGFQVVAKSIKVGTRQRRTCADFKDSRVVGIFGGAPDFIRGAKCINVSSGLCGWVVHQAISKKLYECGKSYNTNMTLWITSKVQSGDSITGGCSLAKYTIRTVAC